MQPIVLDLDGSVTVEAAEVVHLRHWQERLRFACSWRHLNAFDATLQASIGARPVFLGSGDFHHISYALIRRAAHREPCRVVVFDNHPDNMRFALGIHCGSWVSHVANLPGVLGVDVIGITSQDVAPSHLWENRWSPLRRGAVRYWHIGPPNRWAQRLGLGRAFRSFASAEALTESVLAHWHAERAPTYLSIDKDVLHPDDAHTNWDQGQLRTNQLCAAVSALAPQLIGMDITGEVSNYVFFSRWKRWLSAADGQQAIPTTHLLHWQAEHVGLNHRLLAALNH